MPQKHCWHEGQLFQWPCPLGAWHSEELELPVASLWPDACRAPLARATGLQAKRCLASSACPSASEEGHAAAYRCLSSPVRTDNH